MPQQDISTLTDQALTLLESGNLTAAKSIYDKISEIDPNDADAWMMRGAINAELGNASEAISLLRQATTLAPDMAEAHYQLGNILRMTGDLQGAVDTLQQAVASKPDYAEAWLMLGGIHGILGNYELAVNCCRQAALHQPDLPDAHINLANALQQLGNTEEAIEIYQEVLKAQPDLAMVWFMLSRAQLQQENTTATESSCRRALSLQPDLAEAHFLLGTILEANGNAGEAETSYRNTIRLQPDHANAHANLGYVLNLQGRHEEAATAYQQALIFDPGNAEVHYNLSQALIALGRNDEAEDILQTALRLKPDYSEAYLNLAGLLQVKGNYPEAEATLQKAISYNPDSASAHQKLAVVLNSLGRQSEAVTCCQEALRCKPDFVDAHIALAAAIITLQKPDEAMEHCNRALEIEPDNINAISLAANIAIHSGDREAASQILSPLLGKGFDEFGPEHINIALAFALISKDLDQQEEATALLEKLLQDPLIPVGNRSNLLFNLGKLYDATGKYDKAFHNYQQGNASKPLTFDATRHDAEIETLIAAYSPDVMMRMPRASNRSEQPVFVVGMPRSGTSLVEQILASHPQIFGAGELPNIIQLPLSLSSILETEKPYPQCLPLLTQEKMDELAQDYLDHIGRLSDDTPRVIDKMPGNFMHLGLIELLFPNARVIHCMRDPLDTCLSCYFQDFSRTHPYSYDLENLGAFYRGYEKIMRHWKSILSIPVIDVQYEELVSNQEPISRSMIEFCGLEWDEQCLQFHKTERFVGTASYDQVRQPIYKKSSGRWKNYEQHLGPLKEALERHKTPAT